jgi:tetratricopeptide (TPR) repeat protein
MPLPKKTKTPVKKAGTQLTGGENGKLSNGKTGQPAKAELASATASTAKVQLEAFAHAIQLLNQRNYSEAKEWFEKAKHGPSLEVGANAATHVRMCERRLAAPPPEPKSAEDHYNYAVALINLRNLQKARQHLETALEMEPLADHVHYAMAVIRALSGDTSGAYDSLKRAIELQPRNRMVARQDSDFDAIGRNPRFSGLLYPGKK